MREITVIREQDGSWSATCVEISGYVARGHTREDALLAMKRALSLYYPCGECGQEETDPGRESSCKSSGRRDIRS